jgi:hypothetical protein
MNMDLPSETEFGDEQGFMDFLASNELNHQQQQEKMLSLGLTPEYAPMYSDPRVDQNWLGTHYLIHLDQFDKLGLGASNLPDISQCDFKNEGQYADWMADHAYIHDVVNTILGLGT